MAKIASLLLLVAVISVQGRPATYDEILAAAKAGQWDQVQDFSNSQSESMEDFRFHLHSEFAKDPAWKPSSFSSVRNLKPPQGGQVFGEAEYSFHSASNVNGKTTEDHAGHKVINENGKVKEFDFTPSTDKSPLSLLTFKDLPNLKPLQSPEDADSIFHSATAIENVMNNGHVFPQKSSLSPLTFSSIRDLKPVPGGHVFGEADFNYHSATNIDGKKTEDHGGHKIINNNGKIKEFDFKPNNEKSLLSPLTFTSVRDLKPLQGGHVYGEAEYAYHTATNVNGKHAENHGGHKVINHDGKVKEFDFTPSPDFKLPSLPLTMLDKDISDLKKLFMN